jgi:hypothetical protein
VQTQKAQRALRVEPRNGIVGVRSSRAAGAAIAPKSPVFACFWRAKMRPNFDYQNQAYSPLAKAHVPVKGKAGKRLAARRR